MRNVEENFSCDDKMPAKKKNPLKTQVCVHGLVFFHHNLFTEHLRRFVNHFLISSFWMCVIPFLWSSPLSLLVVTICSPRHHLSLLVVTIYSSAHHLSRLVVTFRSIKGKVIYASFKFRF